MDAPVLLIVVVATLAGLVALAIGWRRARGAVAGSTRIDVVTTRYLGGKRMLTVVDVDGERLLLALSGNSVRLVTRLGRRAARGAASDGAAYAVIAAEATGATRESAMPAGIAGSVDGAEAGS